MDQIKMELGEWYEFKLEEGSVRTLKCMGGEPLEYIELLNDGTEEKLDGELPTILKTGIKSYERKA
jgi:hypothetical protein